MMNRFIYLFLLLGCAASALVGCTDDPNVEPTASRGDGGPWVTINFCDNSFDEVNITTRATLDNTAESRVGNLFVFIFNKNGDRIYGRFFDHTNRVDSYDLLSSSDDECWFVQDNSTTVEPSGTVRIKLPTGTVVTDGSIYLLANVNADMVNVSPDKLRFVQTFDDLKDMTASLNQQITERNGFFPMTGKAVDVTVSNNILTIPSAGNVGNLSTARPDGTGAGRILLTRLDAKVEVRLRVAEGYYAYNKETKTSHTIKSFEPLSWQVINLPRTTYVLPHDTDVTDKEMFHTREIKFESRKRDTEVFSFEYTDKDGTKITKNVNTDLHGFSFYMLENRVASKSDIPKTQVQNEGEGYHARETRLKNDDGAYTADPDVTNDIWKYAPAEGTYLVIKGEVLMELDLNDEALNQQLSADAVYYIHLGNFGGKDTNGDGQIDQYGNINNYKIERNTSYVYTITIYGVDKIEIEVKEKKKEDESGATGHVYVAKERIFTFDSHFGSAVVSFDAKHLTDVDNLTWYVRTPFGREGKPHIVNGVEVPAGLDYQWVQFKINSIRTDADGREAYNRLQERYDPKAKNVLDFSKFIKEQKALYDDDLKEEKELYGVNADLTNIDDPTNDNKSAFRREFDDDWFDWWYDQYKSEYIGKTKDQVKEWAKSKPNGVWYRDRIYLTIFVDEFYYDANPLTGDVRQDLWKDFVNQPPRLMHILCDAEKSADEASRSTGSVVTIRQRSIQTIFNTEKTELKTAWGCESVDETRDSLWYYTYNPDGTYETSRKDLERYSGGYWQKPEGPNVPPIPMTEDEIADIKDNNSKDYNYSEGNGLFNTAKIWGLTTGGGFRYKNWSTYVDPNQKFGLCDGSSDEGNVIRTLRYTCMTRNRDENGDDVIDAKEIKWYLAAISQLGSLYVGDQGLDADAVLYSYDKQKETGKDMVGGVYPWRSHIVSSTAYKDYYPEIMWAEEGLSTGSYQESWSKSAGLSVRCVRNLGMDPADEETAKREIMDESKIPDKAIDAKGDYIGNKIYPNEKSVYVFDLTNLNPLSIRYYTTQELEPNHENSVEARPYWKFETGPMSSKEYSYPELFRLILNGKSPCPDGYRTPNVREGALISLRCPKEWKVTDSSDNDYTGRVSTYYSHGAIELDGRILGTGQDAASSGGINYSWAFSTDRVRIDQGVSVKVRCVKDIRQ